MAFAGPLNPGQEQVGFRDLGPGTMRIWYRSALQKRNTLSMSVPAEAPSLGYRFASDPARKNAVAITIAIEILIRINQTLNFIFQSRFD